jgi:hypothetical protein
LNKLSSVALSTASRQRGLYQITIPEGAVVGQKLPRWRLLQSPGGSTQRRLPSGRLLAAFYFEDTFLPAEKSAAIAVLTCGQIVSWPQMPPSGSASLGKVATIPPLPQRPEIHLRRLGGAPRSPVRTGLRRGFPDMREDTGKIRGSDARAALLLPNSAGVMPFYAPPFACRLSGN